MFMGKEFTFVDDHQLNKQETYIRNEEEDNQIENHMKSLTVTTNYAKNNLKLSTPPPCCSHQVVAFSMLHLTDFKCNDNKK
ncbi:CLUMA_CG001320, isoform A [Clunio marinus]|uniref:CLUMA_CG001320, isoform A n=1 Tax=Clunio marinus TaxID=568069 RepID=A0A1J1HHL5_9DIPT|nr:CLUMA_CG001320, isoform A [Clunio marinus]